VDDLDEEEIAVAVHRALIQGCDDGTYFEVHDDGLVIEGRINDARFAADRAAN